MSLGTRLKIAARKETEVRVGKTLLHLGCCSPYTTLRTESPSIFLDPRSAKIEATLLASRVLVHRRCFIFLFVLCGQCSVSVSVIAFPLPFPWFRFRFRFPDSGFHVFGRDPFNQNFRKFRSKTQWIGSVQPEKFRKNGSTFWGGPLSPVGPVGILVECIAPFVLPWAKNKNWDK